MFSKLLGFIPSFSTIKYYVMAGLGFSLVIVYALLSNEKKERAQEKLKAMKKARDTERRVNKATVEGLRNEANSKDSRDYNDDGFI